VELIIPQQELLKIQEHACEGYPYEVVGILAGQGSQVLKVVPLRNEQADTPQNRYLVSGLILMRAEAALEQQGFNVLGYYHSHPDHPARYSDYDKEHALPNLIYAIQSVQSGKAAELQAWQLTEDRQQMNEVTIL
jgi:proteasome lid subunit RPN8/RPN11